MRIFDLHIGNSDIFKSLYNIITCYITYAVSGTRTKGHIIECICLCPFGGLKAFGSKFEGFLEVVSIVTYSQNGYYKVDALGQIFVHYR